MIEQDYKLARIENLKVELEAINISIECHSETLRNLFELKIRAESEIDKLIKEVIR